MAVIFIGLGDVSNYLPHLFCIGASCLHTYLSLTHFTRSYHFHGAGDFLRALDAADLVTYFFSDGHMSLPFQVRHSLGPTNPPQRALVLPGLSGLEFLQSSFKASGNFIVVFAFSTDCFEQFFLL